MRAFVFVFCLEIICSSTANRLFFNVTSDEILSVMTVADAGDEVFVAGTNIIYKLSANLSQLMNVTVSDDTAVSVRGLSLSNGGQYIVACLNNRSCIGYNVIDFSRTMSDVSFNPGTTIPSGDDPVAMFPGAAEGIVYTGIVFEEQQRQYDMHLGRYRLSGLSIMANITRIYNLGRTFAESTTRIFKAGFVIDNFAYYIVEDGGSRIRILRVCNESTDATFQALFETQLLCGSSASFAGVEIVESFRNLTNTLVLTVRSSTGVRSGRVCTYSINDINTAMDNGLAACTAGEDRRAVWDDIPKLNPSLICPSYTVSCAFIHTAVYICVIVCSGV